MLTDEDVNPIGFIKILLFNSSNLIYTELNVPTPTDNEGLTESFILSLFFNSCDVDKETVVFIFSIVAVNCGYVLSKEYL